MLNTTCKLKSKLQFATFYVLVHPSPLPNHETRPQPHGVVQVWEHVRGRPLLLIVANVVTLGQVQEIGLRLLRSDQAGRQQGQYVCFLQLGN